jgi:hypothetical protein
MTSPMSPTEALLREEVEFWRQLIREKENRYEPVLPRMQEALDYAECKLQVYLSGGHRGTDGNEKERDGRLH